MKPQPALPIVVCQAVEAFRGALDGLSIEHSVKPAESYTILVKSRHVLLRNLRRAQDTCSGAASRIRQDLLFRRDRPSPLAVVTEAYTPPPTIEDLIERAHAHEHVHAMGDWIVAAVAGLEEPADFTMAERFADEALKMAPARAAERTGERS